MYKLQNETAHPAHPAELSHRKSGRLVSTCCQAASPQTHGRIDHGGELKVKSDKRNSQQMTENEPGLFQTMAGIKRNEFFLPGD